MILKTVEKAIIRTRWGKQDDQRGVTRDKAKLVVQGYNEDEKINCDETFDSSLNESHKNVDCFCISHEVQDISNRCQKYFHK